MTRLTFRRLLLDLACVCVIASVFSVSAPARAAASVTTLYSFSGTSGSRGTNDDGAYPEAGLTQGSDGNFYGTANRGGTVGFGTIFKVTPAGTLTVLYSFPITNNGVNTDGAMPEADLIQGSDGNFYGTTQYGGADRAGTVFSITPTGMLKTLCSLDGYVNSPPGGLVEGSDGNFYGTTSAGGAYLDGSVYKVTTAGGLTILHNFSAVSTAPYTNADGENPRALVQGDDEDFYGTANLGGENGKGTIFKITPTGLFTTLYSFSATNSSGDNYQGAYPGSLAQGSDGNFYGTTSEGGTHGGGTVFKITPTGILTTLYSFSATNSNGDNNDGADPGSVIQGSDGNFYGTTDKGGTNGTGTLFKITLAGMVTTLYAFPALPYKSATYAPNQLIQDSEGNLYGTTQYGGPAGTGTIFKVIAPPIITGFAPASGPVGTTVTITGTDLTGTTVVGFMGQHAASFTVNAAGTQITTTVPAGAQTGPIAVLTNGIEAKSATSFTVTGTVAPPTITGFAPASGPAGTTVTITGINLTGTTVVGFQGQHAKSFTVNAAGTQITTTMPVGAVTGPIAVLTNGIEAKSSTSFTVIP